MADPLISTVRVSYPENNTTKSRDVKFKGNFGFRIDAREYYTKDGKVYDSNNKEVTNLDLPRGTAYQFIGMSCTAESARDYTYSQKDIKAAEQDYKSNSTISGVSLLEARAASVIGIGAGKVVNGSTIFTSNGEYETQYKSNDTGHISTVSVWLK